MKTKLSFTLRSIFLTLAFTPLSNAAPFCRDGQNITYGGDNTIQGELAGNQCFEIGASSDFEGSPGYAGTGINMELQDGSILSVLGYLKDSNVNSGAVVFVSKTPKIAWDGYMADIPATASNINVNTGSLVRVLDGGTIENSHVNGGLVYVSNTGSANDPGIAINNTVNSGGKLFVYSGALSEGTIVNNKGAEYIQQSGQSTGTIVNTGGLQQVDSNSIAEGSVINAGGLQYVVNTGVVNNTTVRGIQYVFKKNAIAGTAKNTKLYDSGVQNIQEGGKAIGVELFDNTIQKILANSSAENVTINNNAKSWVAANGKILNTTVNHQGQLQLVAAEGATGAYADTVNLNGAETSLLVIANTNDTDNVSIGQLSGSGKVQFKTATTITRSADTIVYSQLNLDDLSGNIHFFFNTSIEDGRGDHLTIKQSTGNHLVTVADSGAEITQPTLRSLDLITDGNSGSTFALANINGTNINAVDGGTYMYSLHNRSEPGKGEIWYLSAASLPDGESAGPGGTTTPSTDAILSMSSVPQLIFNNELNNLRFRKGSLQENDSAAGAWVRLIGNKTHISADNTHFKLAQSGLELGVDKVVSDENGKMFVGGLTSYDSANVKHQRGGTSKVDSYSLGIYATYFAQTGLYLDSVLKYNHFKNDLQARSSSGSAIDGNYHQNALGGSLELGYNTTIANNFWLEPYSKLSYVQVLGKNISLSNGMKARIDAQDSLISELGLNIGKNVTLQSNSVITPYVKIAWSHEYINNNSTTINDRYTFKTNLSGDVGKIGVGVNARFSKQVSLFTELDYSKGHKIETPLTANFGLRYNF